MSERDTEIERLKAAVTCGALLDRRAPVWRLDPAESTRRSLKYRRGQGEIIIVNHDGRGWWDPLSEAKGDIFSLVQHLDPGLSFGDARRVLREFARILPPVPVAPHTQRAQAPRLAFTRQWQRRRPPTEGSAVWLYLTDQRKLPMVVLRAALATDVLREGPNGSAWFAHRDRAGILTGIEMRGPTWRTFSAGGTKTLFRFPGGSGHLFRLAVCESAIDALSLATIEGTRRDTLYVATAGGMGPATLAALLELLQVLSTNPASILVAATDADRAGRRYATKLAELAAQTGVRFDVILPPEGLNDWNDALRAKTG